ncbi:MAG: ACP S-malonyltransferase [bacterium]
MKIGIIFPGQGSQYVGMGKSFYDKERIVQELFEQASGCLDQNFVKLCFASSERDLTETINAQTSIFLISAAIYSVLNQKYNIVPDVVAGHSSGEYSAVFAAQGMNFVDTLYLLKKRANFMSEATKGSIGGMLAVIGLPLEKVKEICEKYNKPENNDFVVEIVNFNAPNQFVLSGTLPELDQVKEEVKFLKGKAIDLNVAGAFHSRLMKDSEKSFATYLVKVDLKDLKIPLIDNVAAKVIRTKEQVKDSLVRQMSHPVLWWPSMQYFKEMDLILEVGPGNKLAKILSREWPEKEVYAINEINDMYDLLKRLDIEIKKDENEEEVEIEIEEDLDIIPDNLDKDKNGNEE